MNESRWDWAAIQVALMYSICWICSALFLHIEPIDKNPAVEQPQNVAPPSNDDEENNYYYPDCEDWEEIDV